jgi:CBS-domain-containing membrane protein
MRIIDKEFKHNVARYILQCALATLIIAIVLVFLDVLTHTATVAALGASSFIAFTMPAYDVSKPRFMIGGYLVGISVGCFCHFLSLSPWMASLFVSQRTSSIVFGALSVGLAIFLMVVTDTEHAPATSVALGLMLEKWDYLTLVFVLCGIIFISTLKWLLKPVLKNLL